MMSLKRCNLCPHNCFVDRTKSVGFCKAGIKAKVALADSFKYEEPCISNRNGSGAVFFANCNLKCVFCQNYEISSLNKGNEVSNLELSNIFLKLQEKGCDNINLVTPTIYEFQIKEAIIIAKEKGLNIPIIYNSSGYENIETLKQLEGYIDIYLPDFKYSNDEIAYKYSGIKNYSSIAKNAIFEMKRQVGNATFDDEGIITKGIIIRHLILPNNTKNSKDVLYTIANFLGIDTYISIMSQYFPTNRAFKYDELNRKITKQELKIVENYTYKLGFSNGYIQNIGKGEEKYVPKFSVD